MKKAKATQIITIVDFTQPQPVIRLECGNCHVGPERIGTKFCSNCGEPLLWDNIFIRRPEERPTEEVAPEEGPISHPDTSKQN
jgi:hypothetical protein